MTINATTWLYVIIQKAGTDERIVGQTDHELDLSFIPAFQDKETAQQAMVHLKLEKQSTYEVQAMIYEDLARYAAEGGFLIFVLDGAGAVVARPPAVS